MQKKLSPQQICSLAAGALFAVLSVVWLVRIFRVLVPTLELVGLIPEMFNGIQYFFLMFAAPLLAAVAMCLRKPALARAAFIAVAASLLINLVNGAINRSIAVLGYPASLALIAGYVLMALAARAPRGRPNLVLSFLPAALVLLGRVLYLVPFTDLDLGYLLSYLDEIAALALAGFAFTGAAARPFAAPGPYAAPGGFAPQSAFGQRPGYAPPGGAPNFAPGAAPGAPVLPREAYCGMAKHVLLLLFTFLIWYFIWIYRTTKHLNALRDEPPRNPTAKLLLCMFVPFYAVYWAYKSGQRADRLAAQRGIPSNISAACLVCAIFIPFVMAIILQNKINAIAAPGGFAPPPQRQNPGAQGFPPYPGAQGDRPVPPQAPAQGFRPVPPQAPAGSPGPSGVPAQPPRAYAPVQTAARPAPAAQGFRTIPPERPQPQAGRPPRPAEPARAKAPAQAAPPRPRPQAAPTASGSPLAGLSEEALTELRAYKELYDIGIVTRAELEAKARELMGK